MSYLFGTQETTRDVVGGPSAADLAAGYRVMHLPDWRAAAANGAGLDNKAFGDNFNTNSKVWTFASGANDHLVSGDANSFVFLPTGTTFAKIQIAWGQRSGSTGTDEVVWRFGAIQSSSGSLLLDNNSSNVNDIYAELTSTEPTAIDAYKLDAIELELTSWDASRISMFYLSRMTSDGADNMAHSAYLYALQLMVK